MKPQWITPLLVVSSALATPFFTETFSDPADLDTKWIASKAKKTSGEQFHYEGEWAIEEPTVVKGADDGDYGLVVKSAARLHGITRKLETPIAPTGSSPFVVQ